MMAVDESLFVRFRRFFLISNILIIALISILAVTFAVLTCMDSCEGFNNFLLIGLALTIPGWAFLILYGFGCYDTEDWRRTISGILAALQFIVFLLLSISYFVVYLL